MVYTRNKKKELNTQLFAILPKEIISYEKDKNKDVFNDLYLFVKKLPNKCIPIESIEQLKSLSKCRLSPNEYPVTVLFRKSMQIGKDGEITIKYLADFVLQGHESDYSEHISEKRLYAMLTDYPIIYRGIVAI